MVKVERGEGRILAIDSGKDCGWALVQSRQLVQCGLGAFPAPVLEQLDRLVVERPHTGQTRARKKDIITLAIRAGEVGGIAGFLSKVKPEYVEPTRWKGSTSKEVSHERVLAKLNSVETGIYQSACSKVAKGKRHNMLDAIGISLFCVGR